MKAAIITTLHHNVGDDFVREGILYLLEKLLGRVEVACIHKHIPVTVRPEWEWYYSKGMSKRLDRLPKPLGLRGSRLIDALPLRAATDKILNCDLLVQSGAPVYWFNQGSASQDAEWFEPLIERRWQRVRDRVPLLNLAAGTCQAYGSDGSEFKQTPATLEHIKKFFDYCRLTTLRDQLSANVLQLVDRSAPVLPCTSIFARRRLGYEPAPPEFITLNYMPAGGHYDFRGIIDPQAWETTFVRFAENLAQQEPCVVVCHNRKEYEAAQELLPSLKCFYSEDHREVLRFYARARFGIVNRVHAAFALASYGRPAFVIGTDTRAHMTEQIQLESAFVGDVDLATLNGQVETLRAKSKTYPDTFAALWNEAERRYLELLEEALRPRS